MAGGGTAAAARGAPAAPLRGLARRVVDGDRLLDRARHLHVVLHVHLLAASVHRHGHVHADSHLALQAEAGDPAEAFRGLALGLEVRFT